MPRAECPKYMSGWNGSTSSPCVVRVFVPGNQMLSCRYPVFGVVQDLCVCALTCNVYERLTAFLVPRHLSSLVTSFTLICQVRLQRAADIECRQRSSRTCTVCAFPTANRCCSDWSRSKLPYSRASDFSRCTWEETSNEVPRQVTHLSTI